MAIGHVYRRLKVFWTRFSDACTHTQRCVFDKTAGTTAVNTYGSSVAVVHALARRLRTTQPVRMHKRASH